MRIAACVEYDGSGFCGWQFQDDVRTVQDEVEKAFSKIAAQPVRVVCAGRTDTGVHAVAQIIHFDTTAERSMRAWTLGANANLPRDITIHWAQVVNEDFHARFSAQRRQYRYVILNRWVRPGILRQKVTWEPQPLDVKRMHQAAQALVGEHDFTSYRAKGCQAHSPVRTIEFVNVSRQGDVIYLDVRANAFLQHMIRNIAGVLIAIGKGDADVAWTQQILDARDRGKGGVTAVSDGLYFVDVDYGESWNLPNVPPMPCYR